MFRIFLAILGAMVIAACTATPDTAKSRAEYQQDLREARFNRLVVTLRDQRVNRFKNVWRTHRPIAFLVSAEDLRKQFLDKGESIGEKHGLELVDSYPVKRLGLYTYVYEAKDEQTLREAAEKLSGEERIESVSPVNTYRTKSSSEQSSDPYGSLLNGLRPETIEKMHELANGTGIEIAIVDTGVDTSHEDLQPARFRATDMVTGGKLPPEEHGTAVAGLITAVADNGIGIRGIAPGADIMMLRACWQEPGETAALCTSDTIGKSLAAALDAEVDIVNLSLTGPPDPLLEQLVTALVEDGVTVVAAHADHDDQGPFPANIPGVIGVTADPAHQHGNSTNSPVYMPGNGILSLMPGNRYAPQNGSSISAAQVSGIAALIKERHPHYDTTDIRNALRAARLEQGDDSGLVQALLLAGKSNSGVTLANY